jgi:hypothetical protein
VPGINFKFPAFRTTQLRQSLDRFAERVRQAPSLYETSKIVQPNDVNLPADLKRRSGRKYQNNFRPFPTRRLPFVSAAPH